MRQLLGYSPIKRSASLRWIRAGAALGIVTLIVIAGWKLRVSGSAYGLPYTARLVPGEQDRWTALGGIWEVVDGSIRNDSNDRGAKILTG